MDRPNLYKEVTAEQAPNDCCGHLLTTLGLNSLYPKRAAELDLKPTPTVKFE